MPDLEPPPKYRAPLSPRWFARWWSASAVPQFGLIGLLGATLLGGTLYVTSEFNRVRQDTAATLETVADLKSRQITLWHYERLGDARVVAQSTDVARFLAQPAPRRAEPGLLAHLETLRTSYGYAEIQVLDARLHPVLTWPEVSAEGVAARGPSAIPREALHQVRTGDLSRHTNGRITMDITAPVVATGSGESLGAVLLRIDPETSLYPQIRYWPAPTRTGETVLLREDGDALLLISTLHNAEDARFQLRLPFQETPLFTSRVRAGSRAGLIEAEDVDGTAIIAVSRVLDSLPWILVAKIDAAEAFGPSQLEALLVTSGVGILILIGGWLGRIAWLKHQNLLLERQARAELERNQAASRLGRVMQQASDGIVVVGPDRRVSQVNQRATELFARPAAEMVGRDWPELLRLAGDERLSRFFANPVSVESLVLESALGRPDGSTLPIEISSRWCQIEQDCEVISIVHDITEREERRQRLVRLNHLYRALSRLNESSARTPTPSWLAAETCRLCIEEGGFTLAWVGWLAAEGHHFSVEVQDGNVASTDQLRAPLDPVPLHGSATAPPQIWKKLPLTFSASRMAETDWPWTERERADLKAVVTLPLHRSGQSDGLLVIGDSKRGGFSAEEIALLEEFAKGISLSHELEARNQARQTAEASLRSSENRLGFLLSATPVIIFTCRPDGDHELTFVSANVESSLNRSASSLLDRPGVWSELVSGEDCDDLLTGLSFLGPGAPLVQEIRFRHPTLLFVWMRMEVKLVLDGDGQPRECVGFLLDVTERRTAERLLREREEQFSAIVSQAADAIVLVDLSNGRFIEFNQVAHQGLGYTREEFEQLTVSDIQAEHDAAIIRENLDRIRQGEAVAFDTLHRTKTGGLRSVRVSARGLTLRGLSCATAVWVDLTERRTAETLLRESRDRLSKAEQMARLGNWDLDLVSNRLTWSDEIYRIFEVDPLKFDATYSRFIERIHPDDRERVDRAFRESVEQHSRYVVAHRLIMPDGRIKYVEESGETLYDAERRPVRSIGTVQDVTAGKLAELELQGLVRELRALHAISQIVEHRESALPVLLQQVVDQLPGATRHPSGVLARIRLEEREVSAGAAGLAQDAMSVMISVDGSPAGSITVGYVTPFSIARDGPIFVQEREMLESVARTVGLALGERESFELTRRSEERFRALFDHAEVGMFETTPAGWITRANRFLGDLIGVPPSVLVGKHWSSFVAAVGDLQSPLPPPTSPRKRRCIRRDTREFWGLLTSRIEHDAAGRAAGHICVLQDISEQISARETLLRFNADLEEKVKQRTTELADSHRELQALLLAVPDLVMRLRTDGTVLYSQRAREATILNELAVNESRPTPDLPREGLLRASVDLGRRALAENAIATGETALDAGGESRSIELRAAPIGMEEFVVFGRDITDRKRMEAKTAAMLERERQVSEMKSRFISVTSHEFRTPMAAAVGSVELLANHHDRLSPAKRSELYGRVTLSLGRMTDMLDDLLTLNRMEARQTEVSWERVDVGQLVRDGVDEIRLGDREAHAFDVAVTGPVASFITDPTLLRHVLSNLLGNAVRYSPAGTKVTLRVSGTAERLVLIVEDQGVGIPASDRDRIFEPFERGSNVGAIKGSGLGLTIVKRMTELMGGTITIDPTATEGTRFLLSFPQPDSLSTLA